VQCNTLRTSLLGLAHHFAQVRLGVRVKSVSCWIFWFGPRNQGCWHSTSPSIGADWHVGNCH
jgi:hypothetical protein